MQFELSCQQYTTSRHLILICPYGLSLKEENFWNYRAKRSLEQSEENLRNQSYNFYNSEHLRPVIAVANKFGSGGAEL